MKLRSLFTVVAVTLISGTVYTVAILKPGFVVADAIDAGILDVSVPMQIQCRVRIRDVCLRPDGGTYPKYAVVKVKARKATINGENILAMDVPDAPDGSGSCLQPNGTLSEACTVLEDGACTDPTVCCANCEPQGVQNACACSSGGSCTVGGSAAVLGVTLAAGSWVGAGCVRKYCGPEIAGEQGQSWPAGCPGG